MEITIENLKKSFGKKVAVDVAEFNIHSGEMVGLVGNNGAGKSTLFRLILDLVKADEGVVCVNGVDVSKTEQWKDWTGAYIDDSFLIDYLTPDEYFQFIAKITDMTKEALDEALEHYKAFMAGEVSGQDKLIRNLSAGNRQKVGIVAAMLLNPKVLILDEPFNFLDPTGQNAMKQLLKEYNETAHATIIVSSHNLTHTIDICPRIALMEDGKIIRDIKGSHEEALAELESYFSTSSRPL